MSHWSNSAATCARRVVEEEEGTHNATKLPCGEKQRNDLQRENTTEVKPTTSSATCMRTASWESFASCRVRSSGYLYKTRLICFFFLSSLFSVLQHSFVHFCLVLGILVFFAYLCFCAYFNSVVFSCFRCLFFAFVVFAVLPFFVSLSHFDVFTVISFFFCI